MASNRGPTFDVNVIGKWKSPPNVKEQSKAEGVSVQSKLRRSNIWCQGNRYCRFQHSIFFLFLYFEVMTLFVFSLHLSIFKYYEQDTYPLLFLLYLSIFILLIPIHFYSYYVWCILKVQMLYICLTWYIPADRLCATDINLSFDLWWISDKRNMLIHWILNYINHCDIHNI